MAIDQPEQTEQPPVVHRPAVLAGLAIAEQVLHHVERMFGHALMEAFSSTSLGGGGQRDGTGKPKPLAAMARSGDPLAGPILNQGATP